MADVACFAASVGGVADVTMTSTFRNELGRALGEVVVASFRPAVLDGDGAALDPTEFAQSFHKGDETLAIERPRIGAQISNGW
jgi:hypothetical protein